MTKRTMLVLIGGRSAVPAIMGAFQFIEKVDQIKYLVCEGAEYIKLQEIAQTFLSGQNPNLTFTAYDIKVVNPSTFNEVYSAVDELCPDPENLLFASLTTAPQTMSIAAYEFLRKKCEKCLPFTVSTDQAKVIPLIKDRSDIEFSKKLDVDGYIRACGHNIYQYKDTSFTFQNKAQLRSLIDYFDENIRVVASFFSETRSKAGSSETIRSAKRIKISDADLTNLSLNKGSLFEFLEILENHEIIRDSRIDNNVEFLVDPEPYTFIAGDWLEFLVYLEAEKCNFDSVKVGVDMGNYNGEIDVFCLHNSNAMIIECKTGRFNKNELFKLRNKAEKLGASYCTKFLVTSNFDVSDEIENEAQNSGVVLLKGDSLCNLSTIFKEQMMEPTYRRR